jgi:hypothetical protein
MRWPIGRPRGWSSVGLRPERGGEGDALGVLEIGEVGLEEEDGLEVWRRGVRVRNWRVVHELQMVF